jgi:DNA-binding GntR family transcriptional regulator
MASPASAPLPRYLLLARELAGEIGRGRLPAGSRLPTEIELSADRGVSRATVRAALMQLEELGLVTRKRRSGTHVAADGPKGGTGAFTQSLAGLEDLLRYAEETTRQIRQVQAILADDPLAARLSVRPGSRWVHVASLRVPSSGQGLPLCWTDSYLDAADASQDLLRRLRSGAHAGLIASLVAEESGRPIDEVTQEIRAASVPDGELARSLGTEAGSAALEITRRYLDRRGKPLTVSISLHPADRFAYITRLRRRPAEPG